MKPKGIMVTIQGGGELLLVISLLMLALEALSSDPESLLPVWREALWSKGAIVLLVCRTSTEYADGPSIFS